MIVLGLTGSIGMGKSTTAGLFAEAGTLVHDADATVHALYAPGGAAVPLVEAAFPGVTRDGAVDRTRLSQQIASDPQARERLEALVHPLVAETRTAFFDAARRQGAQVVVLDVPLLFETGGERLVDAVVVVSAPEAVQRERVLARPGMTPEKFEDLLGRQLSDAEKRARADFIVDTGSGLVVARDQVGAILETVTAPGWTPPRRGRETQANPLDGENEPPH